MGFFFKCLSPLWDCFKNLLNSWWVQYFVIWTLRLWARGLKSQYANLMILNRFLKQSDRGDRHFNTVQLINWMVLRKLHMCAILLLVVVIALHTICYYVMILFCLIKKLIFFCKCVISRKYHLVLEELMKNTTCIINTIKFWWKWLNTTRTTHSWY